ncbi:MAG: DNA import protein CedA1 [Ignisphaera sp.]
MDIITLIKDLISKTVVVAWLLFFLTWLIGWAIKGAPIPMGRVRKIGQGLIEDAVWGAFWVAVGTTIFWLITYIASYIGNALPPPPSPQLP